jgi:hypothetical protein
MVADNGVELIEDNGVELIEDNGVEFQFEILQDGS